MNRIFRIIFTGTCPIKRDTKYNEIKKEMSSMYSAYFASRLCLFFSSLLNESPALCRTSVLREIDDDCSENKNTFSGLIDNDARRIGSGKIASSQTSEHKLLDPLLDSRLVFCTGMEFYLHAPCHGETIFQFHRLLRCMPTADTACLRLELNSPS